MDRNARAVGEAMGVRGAPVIAARQAGRTGLSQSVYDRLFGEAAQRHQLDMARGESMYNRRAGDWQRRWGPLQFTHNYGLQQAALDMGLEDQRLRRVNQNWEHGWWPERQRRQFGHENALAVLTALAGGQFHYSPRPGL